MPTSHFLHRLMAVTTATMVALAPLTPVSAAYAAPSAPAPRVMNLFNAQQKATASASLKVIVQANAAEARQALSRLNSARLLADYGSYALYRLSAADYGALTANTRASLGVTLAEMDTIFIDAAPFNTQGGEPNVPASLQANYGDRPALHLVQFVGPIKDEWLKTLQDLGATPVHYIESNAYLVWASASARAALQTWAGQKAEAQYAGPFHPLYKLGPSIKDRVLGSTLKGDELVKVVVQMYNHADKAATEAAIRALTVDVESNWSPILNYQNTIITVRAADLAAIAALPDVNWVGERFARELMDEVQNQIVAGNFNATRSGPSGPGYKAWLDSYGFSTNPNDYPIVDITDDGIGGNTSPTVPNNPTLDVTLDPRVVYRISCHSSFVNDGRGPDGHGHINASIAVGLDNRTGFPYIDDNGYQMGLGINPYGRVAGTRIFGGGYNIDACGGTDAGVIAASYNAGARISSNSWGCSGCAGTYDDSSQAYDAGTRDALPSTPGNQELITLFAAGNSGPGAATVGTPGNGKNMITVGASENARPNRAIGGGGWTDGCGIGPTGADNAMDVISFSSRGPSPGSRNKPEVIAPGTHIIGTATTHPAPTGASTCDAFAPTTPSQTVFAASSGTSHSTPAVAGVASLYYWWLQNTHSIAQPSPALMKAYMIAHTTYLTGVSANDNYPSNAQGYGMPNMTIAFDSTPRVIVNQTELFGSSGQTYVLSGLSVADPSKPVKVALTWTDAPGSIGTSPQVNNLNLEVELNGTPYLGNRFSGQYSVVGGSADNFNNYEVVAFPPGSSGSVLVRVNAFNIAGDGVPGNGDPTDQDFALVIYNVTSGPAGQLNGTITDSVTTNPIPGAKVAAQLSPTQTVNAIANPGGVYSVTVSAGTYTVTASAYGYFPETVTNVTVLSGTLTTQDFDLDPAGLYVISGFVTSNPSGTPVWATVNIVGASFNPPSNTTQTNPTTGFYSLTVAGGQAYTMTVSHYLHATEVRGIAAPTSDQTENFVLSSTVGTGSLTGFVRNFYTNNPIANATVTNGAVTATTNPGGAFTINGLTPGTYVFTASANLYSPVTASLVIPTGNAAYHEFYLPTSQLSLDPGGLSQTLTLGAQVTNTGQLTISNPGLGSLTFEIQENSQTGFTPMAPTANPVLVVANNHNATNLTAVISALTTLGRSYVTMSPAAFAAASPVTLSASYDALIYVGTTDISTSELDNSQNTQLKAYLDAGGRLLQIDNDTLYYERLSSYAVTYLQATYTDDNGGDLLTGVDLMAGLNPNITPDPFPDYYSIGVDSVALFTYNGGAGNGQPAAHRVARSGYRAVVFAFELFYVGNNTSAGDPDEAVILGRALDWLIGASSDAIPWIDQTPKTGTVASSGSQAIDIGWDAGAVSQPGTYTGTLIIKNNDPVNQDKPLPVTLTVLPPATFGQVTGVVSTSGVCDANYAPVVGASILITGTGGFTASLTSGAGGAYTYWLDQAGNPYTMTVTAPNHSLEQFNFSVSNGSPVTQNVTLRLQASCITLTPAALGAQADLGDSVTNTLTVNNPGALPLSYTVYEAFPPYTFFSVPFSFIDISATGTPLGLADDGEANITAPFAFPFFGTSSTNLRVGNNGAILFNTTIGDVDWLNLAMSSAPNNFIAPFWDDIDSDTGNVYWQGFPDRVIVQWHNRPHFNNVGAATFQAVLYQSGLMCFNYLDTDFGNPSFDFGASATVGVRGASAAQVVQYSFNQAVIPNNTSLCIGPSVDVPWLSTSITNTTGLTGTQNITVTFDAAQVAAVGVYTSQLVFVNNSLESPKFVPVVFTVTAPATFGTLDGVISGLAACDTNPAPLNAAQVVIDGNSSVVTVTTDSAGYFSRELFGGSGTPYTVTVSKSGYVTQTFNVTVTQQVTTTQNAALRLNAPCLGSLPASLSNTQSPSTIVTQTFNVVNTGAGNLTWNILERAPSLLALTGGPTTKQTQSRLTSAPAQPMAVLANVVQDGSFEAAVAGDSPFWTEASVQFGSPLCDVASCGTGGGTAGARSGAWWAWFGGSSVGDTGSLSQTVVITSGSNATLRFYVWVGFAGGSSDFVRVRLGSTELYRITPTATTTGYQLVTVDVSAFADGVARALIFDYSFASSGNVSVDDVEIDVTPGGPVCAPDALSWVTASPVSGSTAGDSSTLVSIGFNSNGLPAGVYTGTLCFNSNAAPTVHIPVTLTVTPDFGVQVTPLNGTAQSANPGATVTYTLRVINTGAYTDTYAMSATVGAFAAFAPGMVGPLEPGQGVDVAVTVTVPLTASAGQPDTANVVVVSDGDPGQSASISLTTTANQVAGVSATAPITAQTGAQGATVNYTVMVTNTGNGADTFNITISGNAFTTTAPASTGALAAGASTAITVAVTVPVDAAGGTVDVANITFTSQFNPASTATRALTTTAAMRLLYLPIVMR